MASSNEVFDSLVTRPNAEPLLAGNTRLVKTSFFITSSRT